MCEIKPKQVWRGKADGRIVRVMAVVENYVMCRRKGATPYLRTINDFLKQYARWEAFEPKEAND